MKDVLTYTNRQIQYHVNHNTVPARDLTTFLKIIKQRQKINQVADIRGDTSDEQSDDEGHPRAVLPSVLPERPTQQGDIVRQRGIRVLTYDDDSETDTDYPSLTPGVKSVKIDNNVERLVHNGGFFNYNA
jgi:hypothetical protein